VGNDGRWSRLREQFSRTWPLIRGAKQIFRDIDGEQRAAAFAYYAFFSLFPLLLLLISVASQFFDEPAATRTIVEYLSVQLPLGEKERATVLRTIFEIIDNRGKMSVLAFLILSWSSSRLFKALVRALNRAWNAEIYNWWQLALKGFSLMGVLTIWIVLGIAAPIILRSLRHWLLPDHVLFSHGMRLAIFLIPILAMFLGLMFFYKFAPRRELKYSETWVAAMVATILLQSFQGLFVLFIQNFGNFNALYGALGGLMISLMWTYLSGVIIIFGGCFCAAMTQGNRAESSNPD
jgi:Ca2+-transporting ATPase